MQRRKQQSMLCCFALGPEPPGNAATEKLIASSTLTAEATAVRNAVILSTTDGINCGVQSSWTGAEKIRTGSGGRVDTGLTKETACPRVDTRLTKEMARRRCWTDGREAEATKWVGGGEGASMEEKMFCQIRAVFGSAWYPNMAHDQKKYLLHFLEGILGCWAQTKKISCIFFDKKILHFQYQK
ncbi:hypothetical protein PIB30_032718 [Stylosanthes scabra]|uniref:Uncharacterized protein n=1 Tax=Stylosanthes scabra TaxID=79078 RepID=A0ABU6SC78_9FABA|nr:hypothetical protein [Stylosanthes scabra]